MIPPFIAEIGVWVGEEPHLTASIDNLFGRRAGYPVGESPRKLDVRYYSSSR